MATTDSDLGIIEEPDADLGIKEDTSVPSAQYAEGERRMKGAEEKYKEPPEIGPFSAAAAKFAEGYVPGFKQMYAFVNKGEKPYEQALKETEELTQRVGKEQPIVSGIAKTVGAVAPYAAAAAAAPAAALGLVGSVGVPAAIGAIQGLGQTAFTGAPASEVALETAKGGALGALIPGLFKGAGVVSRSLAPTAESTAITSALRRTGQTAIKSTVPVGLAAKPAYTTFLDDAATPEERAAAATELVAMGLLPPTIELYKGAQRSALRKTKPMADRAAREGRDLIAEEQRIAGDKAIAEQAQVEARAEAERAKAAESAISEQRKAETNAYESLIKQETGKEVQAAKTEADIRKIEARTLAEEAARSEKRALLDSREQVAEKLEEQQRLSKAKAEDDALTAAQTRGDVAEEARLWEQKNRRAQRAVKDEQRIMSAAKRLASGDQAEIAELQTEIERLKRAEDAIAAGDDPSLRGAIAKEYQSIRHKLETAIGFFRDGNVEPPPEYQQAYDAVRESYLRNTKAQGYTGFGTPDENFIENPRAWAERKKQTMLTKKEAERTGKEADLIDFLDSIVNRDYMAEARAAREGPQVPAARLQEIFADQGLEYNGQPLADQAGVPIKQAFLGGRTPRAPFSASENMQEAIARRRGLQSERDAAKALMRDYLRSEARVLSSSERLAAENLAQLQAKQAAGFSGLTKAQEIEQAVRTRTPMPAGMSEADILAARGVSAAPAPAMTPADVLAREGITPEAARREFEARAAAGRREVEYGTPAPDADTLRLLNLESVPRAVFETMTPEKLRLFSRIRGSGALLGGSVVEKQTPSIMSERSALDPRQSRLQSPFQALAVQDAFTKTLERSLQNQKAWVRFVQTAGKFASIPEFLKQNPDIAKEVSDELAAGTEYTSTVRARRLPPENK